MLQDFEQFVKERIPFRTSPRAQLNGIGKASSGWAVTN